MEQRQPARGRRLGVALATLVGGAAGALLAFLFDPRLGRRRRASARARAAGAVRSSLRRGSRPLRTAGRRVRANWSRAVHRRPPERLDPDDATLAHKVETELFRPAHVPKGRINVNVQGGVVQLRGELDDPELIDDLAQRARKVAGVLDVENLLHLPQTPPPMHQ